MVEFKLTLRSPGAASGASSSRALSYTRPFDDIAYVEKDGRMGRRGRKRASGGAGRQRSDKRVHRLESIRSSQATGTPRNARQSFN